MKNIIQIFAFTLTSALFTNTLYAQQNAIMITPVQPALGKFTAGYELSVGPKTSLMIEYQKWFEHRSNGGAIAIFGIFSSYSEGIQTNGHRFNFTVRQYMKESLKGGFLEGGFYLGKHDIKIVEESTEINPFAIFTNFNIIASTSNTTRYENVRVGGLRLGGGWRTEHGPLFLEFSGGLSINTLNSQNVRPTLGLKPASPYARLAVGSRF